MLDSHCESDDLPLFGNQLADILAGVAGRRCFARSQGEQDSKGDHGYSRSIASRTKPRP